MAARRVSPAPPAISPAPPRRRRRRSPRGRLQGRGRAWFGRPDVLAARRQSARAALLCPPNTKNATAQPWMRSSRGHSTTPSPGCSGRRARRRAGGGGGSGGSGGIAHHGHRRAPLPTAGPTQCGAGAPFATWSEEQLGRCTRADESARTSNKLRQAAAEHRPSAAGSRSPRPETPRGLVAQYGEAGGGLARAQGHDVDEYERSGPPGLARGGGAARPHATPRRSASDGSSMMMKPYGHRLSTHASAARARERSSAAVQRRCKRQRRQRRGGAQRTTVPSRGLSRAARLLPLGSPPCCTADSQRRARAPRPRYRVAVYRCVSFPRCSQSSQSKRDAVGYTFAVSTQCTQSCTCTTVIGREHDSLRATQFATPSRSQQERFFACRETENIHLTAKGRSDRSSRT